MDPAALADPPVHNWDCEATHEVFYDRDHPEEGYPTEEYLEHVQFMDYQQVFAEPWRYVDLIKKGWAYKDYIWEEGKKVFISTGGWSGNESIIEAMRQNMFWWVFWENHRRGGHFTFEMREERPERVGGFPDR